MWGYDSDGLDAVGDTQTVVSAHVVEVMGVLGMWGEREMERCWGCSRGIVWVSWVQRRRLEEGGYCVWVVWWCVCVCGEGNSWGFGGGGEGDMEMWGT